MNQGHQHPRIVKAMTDQVNRLALSSRAFYNDRLPEFSKFVTEYFGYERVRLKHVHLNLFCCFPLVCTPCMRNFSLSPPSHIIDAPHEHRR